MQISRMTITNMGIEYTREKLIEICESANVKESEWLDRDTPKAQMSLGECWALLKAGCDFRVLTKEINPTGLFTNEKTIWIEIKHETFNSMELGDEDEDYRKSELYYLPTEARLKSAAGGDWY